MTKSWSKSHYGRRSANLVQHIESKGVAIVHRENVKVVVGATDRTGGRHKVARPVEGLPIHSPGDLDLVFGASYIPPLVLVLYVHLLASPVPFDRPWLLPLYRRFPRLSCQISQNMCKTGFTSFTKWAGAAVIKRRSRESSGLAHTATAIFNPA